MTMDDGGAAIREVAARVAAAGECGSRSAPDPVNLPMIRHWVQAMGDTNPIYLDAELAARSVHGGLVAPPAMTQVWTMRGLQPADDDRDSGDPLGQMLAALDAAGFTSIVATNSEQEYHRYLRHGEQLTVRASLEDVTGPKRTALGEGWFVTTRSTWYAGTEAVASMLFRVLKFRPRAAQRPPGEALRPAVSRDTEFFWAGTARHELRIQRCAECGVLRHPPGPMCPACGAGKPDYVVAAGTGEVYSYVVHHHPPVPGRQAPFVVALVQLPEGVRIMGELLGAGPERVRIGMPVRAEFVRIDEDLTLPAWREDAAEAPAAAAPAAGAPAAGGAAAGGAAAEALAAEAPAAEAPAAEAPAAEAPAAGGAAAGGAAAEAPATEAAGTTGSGEALPELVLDVTPTLVISTAIATRDFQDVHHDRDQAVQRGGKDIFVNILTTTGLVERYVTDWAGPQALVRAIAIRLGVPCYAGDTLTFSGRVAESGNGDCVVEVVGRCGLGDHVTGRVRIRRTGETQ
jgi:uncharacterized OB-fold protein/acyl dehydratase